MDAVRRVTRCIRTSPRARSSRAHHRRRDPCSAWFGMGRRGASRQERAAASSSSRDASLTRGRCSPRPRSSSCGVDRAPAVDRDEVRLALGEQRVDLLAAGLAGCGSAPASQVLDEAADGLLGVALVGAEDAGRAALDPADGVDAGQRLAVGREHPAALVGQHEVALVERHVGQRHGPVADRAQDEAALDRLDARRRRGRARSAPSSARTISLRRTSIASTLPSPRISTGERRKRSTIRRRRVGPRRPGRELAQQLDVLARGERALLGEPLLARPGRARPPPGSTRERRRRRGGPARAARRS